MGVVKVWVVLEKVIARYWGYDRFLAMERTCKCGKPADKHVLDLDKQTLTFCCPDCQQELSGWRWISETDPDEEIGYYFARYECFNAEANLSGSKDGGRASPCVGSEEKRRSDDCS